MTQAPAPRPDLTDSIGAILAAMLAVLLAALRGGSRRGAVRLRGMGAAARDDAYQGVIECVWRAEAEADFTYEPWVEWEAVPAPWRNGRLLPRRHEAGYRGGRVYCGPRMTARMRGPPLCPRILRDERTGIT